VASLQLRLKDIGDDEIRRACENLMPIAQRAGVASFSTTGGSRRRDALRRRACGTNMPASPKRAALGRDRIVGATCHDSRHLAIEAAEAGADYVAFGAFYRPPPRRRDAGDIETLRWWRDDGGACVAIGGIKIENASPLIEAGADSLPCRRVYGPRGGPQRPSKPSTRCSRKIRHKERKRSVEATSRSTAFPALDAAREPQWTRPTVQGLTFSVRPTAQDVSRIAAGVSYPKKKPATPCRKAAHSAAGG